MPVPSGYTDTYLKIATSPRKRPRDVEACSHSRSRMKFSPIAQAQDRSASEPSVSDESALLSTTVGEEETDPSEVDTDSESELSASSEEPSSESSSEDEDEEEDENAADELEVDDEDENGIVNLRANRGKRPNIKLGGDDLGPDLRPFLADFLPELKKANEELEAQKRAGTLTGLEHTDEEEGQHIEMDLGLGVLEEKDPDAESSSNDSDSDERGIMAKLMAQSPEGGVGIHEVEGT